jgi:non-ribosomal peptide synthase protein (TIGR01720 family)
MKHTYLEQLKSLSDDQRQALAKELTSLGSSADESSEKAQLTLCVKTTGSDSFNLDDIKTFAKNNLPEHCVPQVIKVVEDLPRNASGKLDRQNLPTHNWQEVTSSEAELNHPHENPEFIDDFVAPSNDIEQQLANIWSEVLGCGDISVNDNFLEVGGDSLLSIRILARINKAGLSIATQDFFEFPTIAEQAKVITVAGQNRYEKGEVTGEFELIPIQHWLFERIKIDPHHWNQTILLGTAERLDVLSLERALQKVLMQHDVLSSTFDQDLNGAWLQRYNPVTGDLPLKVIDIAHQPTSLQKQLIQSELETTNHSMQLNQGPLFSLALFTTEQGQNNQLAIAAHHLIIDNESWRIVLEDLQLCWQGYAENQQVKLPAKTSSFKLWSKKLQEYAASPELQAEQSYWLKQATSPATYMPKDMSNPPQNNTANTTLVFSQTLDAQTALSLTKDLPKTHQIEVRDGLICALVEALSAWSNNPKIQIDMEGHGREELFDNVDLSRTVGWFTSVFPMNFTCDPTATTTNQIRAAQKTLKQLPRKGIGHGIIKEYVANNPIKKLPDSEICFNYLGQTSNMLADNADMVILTQNIGQPRSPRGQRAYLIEVNARLVADKLTIDWFYSDQFHDLSSIQALAQLFTDTLTKVSQLSSSEPLEKVYNNFDLEESELSNISDLLAQLDNNS